MGVNSMGSIRATVVLASTVIWMRSFQNPNFGRGVQRVLLRDI